MYIYILGANIYPTGPTSIRSILEIIYVILIISDLFSSSIVLIDSYCLGSNDFGNCVFVLICVLQNCVSLHVLV